MEYFRELYSYEWLNNDKTSVKYKSHTGGIYEQIIPADIETRSLFWAFEDLDQALINLLRARLEPTDTVKELEKAITQTIKFAVEGLASESKTIADRIVELVREGKTQKDIASELKLSAVEVSHILKGQQPYIPESPKQPEKAEGTPRGVKIIRGSDVKCVPAGELEYKDYFNLAIQSTILVLIAPYIGDLKNNLDSEYWESGKIKGISNVPQAVKRGYSFTYGTFDPIHRFFYSYQFDQDQFGFCSGRVWVRCVEHHKHYFLKSEFADPLLIRLLNILLPKLEQYL